MARCLSRQEGHLFPSSRRFKRSASPPHIIQVVPLDAFTRTLSVVKAHILKLWFSTRALFADKG